MRNVIQRLRIDWPSFVVCLVTAAAYVVLAIIVVRHATAAELPTVAAADGINWGWVAAGVVLLIAAIVGGFVVFKRKSPVVAEQVQAAVVSDAEKVGLAIGAHFLAGINKLVATIEERIPPPTLTEALPISGKNGQAGTFTIAVTGDPKADMAAINAQYFG
jgi:uncharacterized membrane protein (DUF485 family)